jgi:hypothetical protein
MDEPWLKSLEERVGEVITRLESLRKENQRLKQQVRRARKAKGADGEACWREEKEEVQRRLEGLVARLEALVSQ